LRNEFSRGPRTETLLRASTLVENDTDEKKAVDKREGFQDEQLPRRKRLVLIAGFEAFNLVLYNDAAAQLAAICPQLEVLVFTEKDVEIRPKELEMALNGADALFCSLLVDYDQVSWLIPRVKEIPLRLCFESALELMSLTKVGDFTMATSDEKGAGMPPAVKALLAKFGSNKEEDRLAGYINFLKFGPKLLKFIPVQKVQDLRNWLEIYSYWNQGGVDNVVSMLLQIAEKYLLPEVDLPPPLPVIETPALGVIHPAVKTYFSSPKSYLDWYVSAEERAKLDPFDAARMPPPTAPRVAILLFRKHVITKQRYIPQMIKLFEQDGIIPIPIFINGVEAHTIVRDLLTTEHEQKQRSKGIVETPSLSPEAITVDAVVNTIGFPLVGGPAGSMEAGRRVDVATQILGAKNIPYIVAGPLLIQDINSWRQSGVQGLQSVVLYSLPELDGAVDTVVLGGLVGDKIALIPERVRKLTTRVRSWVNLKRTPNADKKLAILLYGFPPNVGAVGTAALLNVPASLQKLLTTLKEEGYNLGPDADRLDGESLVAALKVLSQPTASLGGLAGLNHSVEKACTLAGDLRWVTRIDNPEGLAHANVTGQDVTGGLLEKWLGQKLARNMERQWGDLGRQTALGVNRKGELVVAGLQLGNVWLGVQPLLGVEGDPMRLMFERDLTPHPQYAAFYQWLEQEFKANAVVHFGMHGTVEWLPGSPLGGTYESWPDKLLGSLPNLYIYAANNPSESILAKRRGYSTIVSHNVPPYARSGLYKQLAVLKELVAEYREDPALNAKLQPLIAASLEKAGMYEDCPFPGVGSLGEEEAEKVDTEVFAAYASTLWGYMMELENRLFSEGLHVLGFNPTMPQTYQYLSAYFGDDIPEKLLQPLSELQPGKGLLDLFEQHPELFVHEKEGSSPDLQQRSAIDLYRSTLSGEDWWRFQLLCFLKFIGNQKAAEEIETQVTAAVGNLLTGGSSESSSEGALEKEKDPLLSRLKEAMQIKMLLNKNSEEISNIIKGLGGQYIPPGVGGDLLRDGPGVLPTGRNIHALDPYRMPSPAAFERGRLAAQKILDAHLSAEGKYPETVAVMLWGLDTIKTRGESIGIALGFIGAQPIKEGTGRIVKYELIPLNELGRPRVDILASLSGIFRDSFANVVDLLDDVIAAAVRADEPLEMNYIKKHSISMEASGISGSTARLFSNPAGDYGSMVNERVSSGEWEKGEELGNTWQNRNSYSYGKKTKGANLPQVMDALLKTTDRIVQEIDSVEYGLTDIQEYYDNTGALKKAAETAQMGKKESWC